MDPAAEGSTKPASISDHLNERTLPLADGTAQSVSSRMTKSSSGPGASAVIFRPSEPIILPTSDINIDFERRNKATYGFTMVTSVAHVWFNTFFESQRSSTSQPDATTSPTDPTPTMIDPNNLAESGVFEMDWDAMDGIKGSVRKGIRALDRLAVVWRAVPKQGSNIRIITEPAIGEPVPESTPADWTKANSNSEKNLGLRTESPTSEAVSRASSVVDMKDQAIKPHDEGDSGSEAGIRPHGPEGEEHIPHIPPAEHPTVSLPSTSTSTPVTASTSKNQKNLTVNSNSPTVDLGIEKTHSPAHSPGMVRDVGLGKVAGIADAMRAEQEDEGHVPRQVVREEEGPKDS
uniref:Putative phosphatases II n=1 Tax=Cladonia uncialis subsp. uncialis TaxID=180999 RepID=A0A2K9YDM9_CLAUC|nr:putative phosphatases II [Cladonia uncialis subsp. uncialis]